MAYQKLNLPNGIPFNADHVAHIEKGIAAAHDKFIVGVKDGTKITFSKTAAEIYDIGKDLLNYEVVLIDDTKLYRATAILTYSTAETSKFMTVGFVSYVDTDIHYYRISFYKTSNTISYSQPYGVKRLYDIPNPQGYSKQKYLVINDGKYELSDGNRPDNPVLMAALSDGVLIKQGATALPTIAQNMMESYNVSLLLVVVELNSSMSYENVTIYQAVKICNVSDATNMYAIFANGIDKNIKMDAEGNFSYME